MSCEFICNDGEGSLEYGNYNAELSHAGIYYGRKGSWKKGKVLNHKRMLSPYHLVRAAIDACLCHRTRNQSTGDNS